MMVPNRPIGPCAAAFLALPLLAACASEPEPPPNMGDACQTRECVCAEIDPPLFQNPETTRILWVATGEAYCPDGFKLQLAPEEKNKKRQ